MLILLERRSLVNSHQQSWWFTDVNEAASDPLTALERILKLIRWEGEAPAEPQSRE